MQNFKRSHPTAAQRRLYFTQVLAADLQSRQTGASGWTVHVVKPDGTDAAGAGSVGEQDATDAAGLLYYQFTTGELDTPGNGVVRLSKSTMETREMPFHVESAVLGTAATGTLSASSFTTSLTTSTANHWSRAFLRWLTGNLAGQVGKISSYAVSGGQITMANGHSFTGAPANGDVFEIINA